MKILLIALMFYGFSTRASEFIEIQHTVGKDETPEEIIGQYIKPNIILDRNSESIKAILNSNNNKTEYREGEKILLFFKPDELKARYIPKKMLIVKNKYFRYRAGIGTGVNKVKISSSKYSSDLSYYDTLIFSYSGYDYIKKINIYTSLDISPIKSKLTTNINTENNSTINGSLKLGTYLIYKKTIPLIYAFYERKPHYIINSMVNDVEIQSNASYGLGLGITQYIPIFQKDLTLTLFYDKSLSEEIEKKYSKIGVILELMLLKNYGISLSGNKYFYQSSSQIEFEKYGATISYFY